MKAFILGVLTCLVLVVIIGTAYQIGKKNSLLNTNSSSLSIIPTSNISSTITTTSTPTPTVIDDAKFIKSALIAKNNWSETLDFTVDIKSNDGKYANGTVASQGGGGYFYALKIDNNWEIIADGNGIISCSSLTKYPDYPKSLISECYDQKTDKLIKR